MSQELEPPNLSMMGRFLAFISDIPLNIPFFEFHNLLRFLMVFTFTQGSFEFDGWSKSW